jgi:hypothetical protein
MDLKAGSFVMTGFVRYINPVTRGETEVTAIGSDRGKKMMEFSIFSLIKELRARSKVRKNGDSKQPACRHKPVSLLSCKPISLLCLAMLAVMVCPVVSASSDSNSIRGAFSLSGFATGVGTRAMGMNGAFAAVSDDSWSAYWNPAGLTSSWYKELSFTRADLYDLDLITNNALNISAPETRTGAMSFGWTRLQYDFENWDEDVFIMSYAKTLIGKTNKRKNSRSSRFNVSLGVTLKYLRQSSKLDISRSLLPDVPEEVVDEGEEPEPLEPVYCKARGFGLDIGLLARIKAKDGRNRFSLGLAVQDAPTMIEWNSGDLENKEYVPYRYKVGCSFEPLPRLTVAFDVVGEKDITFKELHLGMEHWIFPVKYNIPISEKNLAIRGGIAKQLSASERMTYAAGLGIRWDSWQLDYAYLLDNNGLGDTRNRFSISVRF